MRKIILALLLYTVALSTIFYVPYLYAAQITEESGVSIVTIQNEAGITQKNFQNKIQNNMLNSIIEAVR